MPAETKLPVKKYTKIAAIAAIGNAKRNPMINIAIKPIISKTSSSHQKFKSEGLKTCIAYKIIHNIKF